MRRPTRPLASPAPVQFFETRKFVRVSRNNYFPADFMGDFVFPTELDHGRRSTHAQTRLHRAGLVVDAGVNDAAVVAALMPGNAVFFFEEQ